MDNDRWQFWIDVGGTFTDCVARRPDGSVVPHKVLSSGVTKGSVGEGSTTDTIIDSARESDPPEFWIGYTLRLLDERGASLAAGKVLSFDAAQGRLTLDAPLPCPAAPGQPYELTAGEEAPILAIRYLLGLNLHSSIPPIDVRLGTTRGTNALLTRTGARTAFVTTRGFGDLLAIGNQDRPRLFELAIHKRTPLYEVVVEIDERITPVGEVLIAPDEPTIRRQLQEIKSQGIESLAICLLHAYAQPGHEIIVERLAREVGFEEISTSHRIAPLIKFVSRGDTTMVDGYLNPVLRSYLAGLGRCIDPEGNNEIRVLTSAGDLARASKFSGKDSILSGPAGGVVGFAHAARAANFEKAIGFDMGGTSTDVSRFDGTFELEYETEKGGVRIASPTMAIETVAAGGGSVCRFDGVKLVVGPESAGADPGPACYGRGGPLAVTDLNLYLGRIVPAHFPFPLDLSAVKKRLTEISEAIESARDRRMSLVEIANGFIRVANANMASAIRVISTAKGVDVRDYVLVAFGGAAPQHACAVARELGMRQILHHPHGGVLSALGAGLADVACHRVASVLRPLDETALRDLDSVFETLTAQARQEVEADCPQGTTIELERSLDLRYRGTDASITIAQQVDNNYRNEFEQEHRRLYGYLHEERPLEIVAARVRVVGRGVTSLEPAQSVESRPARSRQREDVVFEGDTQRTSIFHRDDLAPGDMIAGPAILAERGSTVVIEPGWIGEVLSDGQLSIEDTNPFGHAERTDASKSHDADPITLELFNNHFASIARQMGMTLRNTSSSVNVKERLDFSCALFTATGDLVVNAPHIPVHLGAMSETVRCILADNPEIQPGDVFLTNDPGRGGSHLPDLTVVTPVFDDEAAAIQFFTASRAHHAEIGGVTPGSMPPFSRNLSEEGILFGNAKLVDAGELRLDALRKHLLSGPNPTRAVDDNLADIQAQIAANRCGEIELKRLVGRHSWEVVATHMQHIQAAAETKMRAALARLPDGTRQFTDHLDDGAPICVSVTIDGDEATIDFTGTGPTREDNLNANRAIVTAAVMYCLRLLIDDDIPLNQGVLAPVTILLPNSLLHPRKGASPETSPAVAGGNVETSQRVVDVLLGAFGLAAASQGTMNNLLFGDAQFGYYETICGGAGATADHDGADAVHTHLTNTRITDPEVLEHRYPARLREFSIRRGSGGKGKYCGGDGVVRRIEFLSTLEVSILSQRRGPYPPYGFNGGEPGSVGRNLLERADGTIEPLPGICRANVEPGDILTIETPGGGGWGEP